MNTTIEFTYRDMDVVFFRKMRNWSDIVLLAQHELGCDRELAKQFMRVLRTSLPMYNGHITLPRFSRFVIRNDRLVSWHMDFTWALLEV